MKGVGLDWAYALIFDNLLGISLTELTRLTNLHLILEEALMISDSWCMTNQPLQKILTSRSGVELIRGGLIIPMLRNTSGTFVQVLEQFREKKLHGLTATDAFAKFLDQQATALEFNMAEVDASYRQMSDRVLSAEILIGLGVSESSAHLVAKLISEGGEAAKTNTFVKDEICPKLSQTEARIVMDAARAPYSLNLPMLLNSGIVAPQGFQGDQILSVLRSGRKNVGALGVVPEDRLTQAAFRATIREPLISWLLSDEILTSMTPEELVIARSTSDRPDYLKARRAYLAEPSELTWMALLPAIELYLKSAGTAVFGHRRSKNAVIGSEPTDAMVHLEGAETINVVSESTVILSPLQTDESGIQVVGRMIAVPQGIGRSIGPVLKTIVCALSWVPAMLRWAPHHYQKAQSAPV